MKPIFKSLISFFCVFPFVENFNNLPTDGNIYRPELLMPSHWNTYYVNKLNDTLHVGNLDEGAVSFSDWKTFYQDPVPGKSNGSVMYSLSLMSGASLVTLPLINIESAQAPYLHFDAALGLFANDAFDTLPAESVISGPYSLRILVSNDKGKSFILSNSLQVWDSSNIDNLRDSLHCKIDLSQYNQDIVIAFLVIGDYDNSTSYALYLDNIGIYYERAIAQDLEVSDITQTSATLTWREEITVDEWIVKLESETGTKLFATSENRYELTGLDTLTDYVAHVGNVCAENDTVWASVEFTTGGVGNEGDEESDLFLTASRHQIHLMNPSALPIERVRVYNLSGAMAEDYVIRSNENVILTTALSTQVVVVEVLTPDNKAYRFKVMLP